MPRSDRGAQPFLILSTTSSLKEAKIIAAALIRQRAAACVNIVPRVLSQFHWKGKIEQAREQLLFIKTSTKNAKRVEHIISKLHSYEVPEIIGWPIKRSSKAYLAWLRDSIL